MQQNDIETGTVLKCEGEWAMVITNKSKSCRECGKAQAGICGKSGAGMVIKVRNPVGAKSSDTVLLELDRSIHIKAYFLAFILPVAILFLCTYAGYLVSQSSGIKGLDVTAGFIGLAASAAYSLNRIRSLGMKTHLQIGKILHDAPESYSSSCPEETDYLAAFGHPSAGPG
jgi:positive regulator of sigma E activity